MKFVNLYFERRDGKTSKIVLPKDKAILMKEKILEENPTSNPRIG